jgi:uncharacterized protein YkwD
MSHRLSPALVISLLSLAGISIGGPADAARATQPSKHGSELGEDSAPSTKNKLGFVLSAQEEKLLDLTNDERAKKGLPPLRPNKKLFQAARAHSANMAKQDTLAHTLDDKGPADRLKEVGYQNRGWAENCAAGQQTAAQVVESWMESKDHRANILNKEYVEIGIGSAANEKGTLYYTQVFGAPAAR